MSSDEKPGKSNKLSFEDEVLAYFREQVGERHTQRLDGIEVYSELPKRWFWKRRLDRMVRKGLLHRIDGRGNFWASTRHLHHYGLPKINEDATLVT